MDSAFYSSVHAAASLVMLVLGGTALLLGLVSDQSTLLVVSVALIIIGFVTSTQADAISHLP
jgi:hypothetical protein